MILTDMLGWFAAGLVFSTFCARGMVPLRILAVVSNIAFVGYGTLDQLWPILILHLAMLPMNLLRLRQALGTAEELPDGDPANVIGPTSVAQFRAAMRSSAARRQLIEGNDNVRRFAIAR
jgi:hypothetical protein